MSTTFRAFGMLVDAGAGTAVGTFAEVLGHIAGTPFGTFGMLVDTGCATPVGSFMSLALDAARSAIRTLCLMVRLAICISSTVRAEAAMPIFLSAARTFGMRDTSGLRSAVCILTNCRCMASLSTFHAAGFSTSDIPMGSIAPLACRTTCTGLGTIGTFRPEAATTGPACMRNFTTTRRLPIGLGLTTARVPFSGLARATIRFFRAAFRALRVLAALSGLSLAASFSLALGAGSLAHTLATLGSILPCLALAATATLTSLLATPFASGAFAGVTNANSAGNQPSR